ncbi:MAG: excalibur calcium-binding domain-containing protein [Sphingomicrobium sp.]
MRSIWLLIGSAVTLGLAGGYAWSSLGPASAGSPRHAKATTIAVAPSPEERPAALDREWAKRADDQSAEAATSAATVQSSVTYSGCNAVRAAGKAPLYAGQPGYSEDMDGDGDGIACEPHRAL